MQNLSKTGSYFGDPGGTYPPKLYLSTPPGYGVSDTLLFRQTLFSTRIQNVFLECLQVFLCALHDNRNLDFSFFTNAFLLACTLCKLNKTIVWDRTLRPSRYAFAMITKKTKINGRMGRATWHPEWRSVTILHWSRSLPHVVLFFKNAYYRIFCKKKRIMVYRDISG